MQFLTSSLLFTIPVFLVAIAILIAVHEAGHFFVARWCKVKVLRFAIGFGRPIWRRVGADGTEYVLAAIPLGGYVRMLDSRNDTLTEPEYSSAFDQQNVYKRIAIVAAGPLVNLIFAALLYAGVQYAGVSQLLPVIGQVASGSPAASAQIPAGQLIRSVDGVSTKSWQDVNIQLLQHMGETKNIQLQLQALNIPRLQAQAEQQIDQRVGQELTFEGAPRTYSLGVSNWLAEVKEASPISQLGFRVWRPQVPVKLDQIMDAGAAQLAGLKSGDVITHLNNEPVDEYAVFVNRIKALPDQSVMVTYRRQGEVMQAPVQVQSKQLADGSLVGVIGVSIASLAWPDSLIVKAEPSLWQALQGGVAQVGQMISLTFQGITRMIMGEMSVEHLSGPISIAKVATDSAAMGLASFVTFLAYISVSLGVLNLLPVPMLDGGHLLYYLVELITGKPVSDGVQQFGMRIGMALVGGLMFLAIFNDIARL